MSTVFSTPFKALHLLIAGDVMLDRYWYGAVERISPEAPVPVMMRTKEEDRLGGAANVAHNIRGLGARATLMCTLAHDDAGEKLLYLAQKADIQTLIHWLGEGACTTQKLRMLAQNQQLLRVDQENPIKHREALDDVLLDKEEKFDALVLSDYEKGAMASPTKLLQWAKKRKIPVVVDSKRQDYGVFHGADVVTPNRAELRALVGPWQDEGTLSIKVQNLRQQLSLGAVLLTRSEEGMSLYDAQGEVHIPAFAQEVFDVTGAGDTVVAVLAVLLAYQMPLRQAITHANAAAATVVAKLGTARPQIADLQLPQSV